MTATQEEIIQANREFRQKEKLENMFKPEIKKLFARMIRDFAASVLANGDHQNTREYLNDWEVVIKIHYERVQRAFSGTVAEQQKTFMYDWYLKKMLGKQDNGEERRLEALLATALIQWRNLNSKESAGLIVDTSLNNMSESLTQARELLIEAEESIDNRNVAATATPILKRKFAGRVDTIALTETQKVAESSKLLEAEALSGIEPIVIGPALFVSATKKAWVTVGDKKVRTAHQRVNGQVRSLQEPFVVAGERLMYPGDSSLGASALNTVNCRCSSQYRIAA